MTATYERPAALRCAIEGVQRQTFDDWELIVVGDACSASTAEVVASFDDPRIRYLNLSRNFGEQAGPNNYGVAHARAPLIAFLNHDDVWLPNHLRRCFEVLHGEQADLVFGAAAIVAEQTTIPLAFPSLYIALGGVTDGRGWSPNDVERSTAVASSWLFRRTVFDQLRGWRLGRDCYTDPSQDFLFRAWRTGFRIRPVNELTVVVTSSGRRPGSYLRSGAPEQEWVVEHLDDPAFPTELAALAYDTNEAFVARNRTPGEQLRSAVGGLLSSVGISPRSLDFRLRRGHRRGDYIRSLRRLRGLPTPPPPSGGGPAMRFAMVRGACRIDPPFEVSFAAGQGGGRFLASGWSRPEATGVWNDGPHAELLFDVGTQPAGDAVVDLEVTPFLGASRCGQTVEVTADGVPLSTFSLGSPTMTRIVVPHQQIRTSLVHLGFRFPTATSPSGEGLSGDGRLLAMHLARASVSLAPPRA